MADQFTVNHGGYSDVNSGLVSQVVRMDAIMDDLNTTLSRIAQASNGKATPLWEDQQNTWNRSYTEMKSQLNTHTQSSISVAETFQDGDNHGARVMS
ncbi:hypothetical protein [Actinomadura sp. DC4]|uniref:hypothetical protein n=1 Tax=Actinomadura sp. DC4 TaxID=3055069 RepID=UPI0025B1DC14|nr:hypothetical protein [Actinomadura sp. DC4]MDN3359229.1 hypothetical protein [Actinomadura sp. DC4]